jgi:ketosteroid isomerase-like protein
MRKGYVTAGVLTAAAVVLATATAEMQVPRSGGGNVRAAIEAANKKSFIDGATKRDPAMMASVYTDDAIAYPANSEPVKGKAALQGMWKSVLDMGIAAVELNTAEVEAAGDLAYETGTYAMKLKDGTVADRGKYVVVWKRMNREWKLHRDIWTTSLPAPK